MLHRSILYRASGRGRPLPLPVLALALACTAHAHEEPPAEDELAGITAPTSCLPDGAGYLRARVTGTLNTELDWSNEGTECSGAVRPTDGGIRMRFSRADHPHYGKLVLVFGIAKLREGRPAKAVPVNVTVIREGQGEFYSTQGDDKCMLDDVAQEAIVGIPHRTRSYRIVARGFCTEPARAVRGEGAVLLSRFDYAGRVDFESEAGEDEDAILAVTGD